MPASDTRPILARKIAAHAGIGLGAADLPPQLEIALTRALRRAGAPLEGLAVSVESVEVGLEADLQAAIDALPDHGLIAATEDMDGRRGLMALEHSLVDALIEVQTTGRVEETQGPPRSVTRIDEALCADFIDLMFSALAHEGNGIVGRTWPERIRYASQVPDRSQINLLLPGAGYHLLQAKVKAAGLKEGKVLILLPTDPALARRAPKANEQAKQRPKSWEKDMLAALGSAPLALNAVLLRVHLPLSKVENLVDGDLIPFDPSDLSSLSLEEDGGHVIARGKLGQIGGRRAVRLGDGDGKGGVAGAGFEASAGSSAPPTMAAPAPAPMPDAMGELGGEMPADMAGGMPADMPGAMPLGAAAPDPPGLPELPGLPDIGAGPGPGSDPAMDGIGLAPLGMMGADEGAPG
jgi:flagellar motor switch protein FliM